MKILYLLLALWCLLIVYRRSDIIAYYARLQWQKGDSKKALKAFKLAEKIGKLGIENQIVYGYAALKDGNTDLARRMFNRVSMIVKPHKTNVKQRIKSLLALVEWKEGNLDLAIEMLEDVISNFKTTVIYQSLGLLYLIKGDKEKALQVNLEAYDYNSDDTVIMDNLAEAYVLCGDIDKAEKLYENLMKKEPHFPEAYYGYGVLLAEKGEREKGAKLIRESLNKNFSFLSVKTRDEVEQLLKDYES